MSRTVVLVGYSTSGKSFFGKKVESRFAASGKPLEYRDSDLEIGIGCGGHIYQCYISMGYANAVQHIEAEERTFLDGLQRSPDPRLVITGPNMPLREPKWSNFIKRVDPIVYYLEVEPGMCRSRLADRENNIIRDNPGIDAHVEFGSWNFGTLRDRDSSGAYVPVPQADAVTRIGAMMVDQVMCYTQAVTGDRTYRARSLATTSKKRDLVRRIEEDLT